MKKILVTGITGKSGKFFYEELRKNEEGLTDYQFDFIVRNEKKAREQLTAKGLNQSLKVGSLLDKNFVRQTIIDGGGIL